MQDQYRRLSRTLIVTLVVVFSILIAGGLLIFKNEAPRPAKIVTEAGTTLVSKQQLISGQATYEKYQLADYGTYLGNGGLLGTGLHGPGATRLLAGDVPLLRQNPVRQVL